MKKTFKLIGMCLVALAMTLNFAACTPGDDDDNNGNTPGGNDGGGTGFPTTAMSSTTGRNLAGLNMYGQVDFFFDYDAEGRVVKQSYTLEGTEVSTKYVYHKDSIEATYKQDGELLYTRTFTLSDGLITQLSETYGDIVTDIDFQYQDRQLTNVSYKGATIMSLMWEDGNIVQVYDPTNGTATFDYDENANSNNRIELYGSFSGFTDYGLLLQGYYGNGTRHRQNHMSMSLSGMPVDADISYVLDEAGDVSVYSIQVNAGGTTTDQIISFTWQ